MLQLIVGKKGSGKTKALVSEVNKVAAESDGAVVCVEYGRKLTFDIMYHARLVDALDYGISDAEKLYGFVCGILATNYDITELFIDSALKICENDMASFEKFTIAFNRVLDKAGVDCVMSASVEYTALPETLKPFVRHDGQA